MRKLLAFLTAASFAAACSSSAERARQHASQGDKYAAAGQFDAAILEYRNAVKYAAEPGDLYRRLGDSYVAIGKNEEAYRAFANAIDADPSDLKSPIEAGRLLLASRLYDQAQLRAEQVLDRDPLNADARVLRYRAIGEAALATGDQLNAEAAFRSGVEDAPQSPEAYVALAQFLIAADREKEAEPILHKAVDVAPSSELANRAIATFLISVGKTTAAEPYLITAAAQPHQRYRSTLALADYYYAAHRYADARAALEHATGDAARVRLAAIDYETGARSDARKRLDQVLKKRPPAEGLALNAQLLADEKKTDQALQSARAALAMDPDLAAANYLVGVISQQRGELTEAERSFDEVLRVMPDHGDARVRLAQVRLASGHAADALDLLGDVQLGRDGRLTLARALLEDGQTDRARQQFTALASDATTDPEPDIELGRLDLQSGDLKSAAAHSARALTLSSGSAAALQLAGRVAIAQGDFASAGEHLTRAVTAAPDDFDTHALLAHVYRAQGDSDRARTMLEQFAKRHADSAASRTAVGVIYDEGGDAAKARSWYEQALTIDPHEPVASGNLARLYLSDTSKLDEAIDLARTSITQSGDQADVHDTLGWAYFKTGRIRPAVAELERAVALAPHDAAYQQHLAEARRVAAADAEQNKATALIRR
jgi:tetratricopeptide (TPR) repeat protein